MLFLCKPLPRLIPALFAGFVSLWSIGIASEVVKFNGLASIPEAQAEEWIATQLEFIESTGVNMARADDVAYFLENALRERGYKEATVDWEISESGEVIILNVSEGTELNVGEIVVVGNEAIEDEGIAELLTSATRKRIGADIDETIPYVAADVKQGVKRVEEFYLLLGYGDVSVDLETDFSSGKANLAVAVIEGQVYKVGEITLPEPPAAGLEEAYAKIREDFKGKSYSEAIPANLSSRMREIGVNAGFYNTTASAEKTTSEVIGGVGFVNVVVTADWGGRVNVSGISVTGNDKVKSEFFNRHFEEVVGSPYSPDKTNESVEELLQTGAFETVRTDIVEQPDGSFLLDVDVEEGYSRTLGVYAGFATYEGGIFGFEFRNLNLLGSVRKIDANLEASTRGARGELKFSDPWFLWSDWEFNAGVFGINRAEEGYEKFQAGGRYDFTRKFGRKERNAISIFGEASSTDVHQADISPNFLGDRTYFTNSIGVSITHDRRDNPRSPRSGFIAQASASIAPDVLGSEVEFFKATGRLGYYIPVGAHTLRLAGRAGVISPMGDTDAVPIDLRFFSGGANTVRSFQERALGFQDPASGFSVGGEFFTVFNVEYEIPVGAIDGLSIVPFADAGNLIRDADDASLDDLRYAVGLGIRYQTPIGPLRLEYGYNPDQREGEPQGTFHVGFGFAY